MPHVLRSAEAAPRSEYKNRLRLLAGKACRNKRTEAQPQLNRGEPIGLKARNLFALSIRWLKPTAMMKNYFSLPLLLSNGIVEAAPKQGFSPISCAFEEMPSGIEVR